MKNYAQYTWTIDAHHLSPFYLSSYLKLKIHPSIFELYTIRMRHQEEIHTDGALLRESYY